MPILAHNENYFSLKKGDKALSLVKTCENQATQSRKLKTLAL